MKVVVCDDNKKIAEQISGYISNFALIEGNGIEVTLQASSPNEVIQYIQTERADCFFLDIDLCDTLTGFDVAKIIRKSFPLASIIFVTTHDEMLSLVFKYQVEALDYIIKDEPEQLQINIIAALKSAFEKYIGLGQQQELKFFQLEMGDYIKNINVNDILFFKSSDIAHRVKLSTLNGEFELYRSLTEIEKLDNSFFRSHKGYVVNLNNVSEVNWKKKTIVMNNHSECPISFRKIKSLRDKWKID